MPETPDATSDTPVPFSNTFSNLDLPYMPADANPFPINTPFRELGLSLVRTFVPIIVVKLLTLIAFDPTTLTMLVDGLLAFVYYAVVRFLELHVAPRFGWLLGFPRTPSYS